MTDYQNGKLSRVGLRQQSKISGQLPDTMLHSQKSSIVKGPQIKPQILRNRSPSELGFSFENLEKYDHNARMNNITQIRKSNGVIGAGAHSKQYYGSFNQKQNIKMGSEPIVLSRFNKTQPLKNLNSQKSPDLTKNQNDNGLQREQKSANPQILQNETYLNQNSQNDSSNVPCLPVPNPVRSCSPLPLAKSVGSANEISVDVIMRPIGVGRADTTALAGASRYGGEEVADQGNVIDGKEKEAEDQYRSKEGQEGDAEHVEIGLDKVDRMDISIGKQRSAAVKLQSNGLNSQKSHPPKISATASFNLLNLDLNQPSSPTKISQLGSGKGLEFTEQGVASTQQQKSDTDVLSNECQIVSSEMRIKEKASKLEDDFLSLNPNLQVRPQHFETKNYLKKEPKDYSKYLDGHLNKNSKMYKPPVVEKNCLSTFQIKPAQKEDLNAKIKQIQSKYNLVRTNILEQYFYSPTSKQPRNRTSYNLKSFQTFEKVESLLNLNQPSQWHIIATDDTGALGTGGIYPIHTNKQGQVLHNRSPEPFRTSFNRSGDVLGPSSPSGTNAINSREDLRRFVLGTGAGQENNGHRQRGQFRSLTRSMIRDEKIVMMSSNQSGEWQESNRINAHLYHFDKMTKANINALRPSSSGHNTSPKQLQNLSASFNFSKKSVNMAAKQIDSVQQSSKHERFQINSQNDCQINNNQYTNDDQIQIISKELDLTSMKGIQPSGTLFYTHPSLQQQQQLNEKPQLSSIKNDNGTVEHIDYTIDANGMIYSGEGHPMKEMSGLYSFGHRSINKTLISIQNYDGFTVPRQPNYNRQEQSRYSPIRITDNGPSQNTVIVQPDTMENDEFFKRDSKKTEMSPLIQIQASKNNSIDQNEKQSSSQVRGMIL